MDELIISYLLSHIFNYRHTSMAAVNRCTLVGVVLPRRWNIIINLWFKVFICRKQDNGDNFGLVQNLIR